MNRRESIKPKRPDALSRELLDELLVYDGRTHRGHCLNQTAAAVWRLCDGETTIPGMTRTLQAQLDPGIDEQIVRLALARLKKAGLLVDGTTPEDTHTIFRRELMRKIGKNHGNCFTGRNFYADSNCSAGRFLFPAGTWM